MGAGATGPAEARAALPRRPPSPNLGGPGGGRGARGDRDRGKRPARVRSGRLGGPAATPPHPTDRGELFTRRWPPAGAAHQELPGRGPRTGPSGDGGPVAAVFHVFRVRRN
ncbi:hypothetical protein Shyhy02_16530 [Streptomyces hygroscopicus subsp. hygroscopicus]|nr:hypothetical protein Shyhy02_16530 [Streptomyces hygroscopicus subsp. hygroscopicus]